MKKINLHGMYSSTWPHNAILIYYIKTVSFYELTVTSYYV